MPDPASGRARFQRVDDVFAAALELPLPERDVFLREACADEDGLRAEVEALLAADAAHDTLLDEPLGAVLASPWDRPKGDRLGQYRLLSEIGRGGMGTVFLAEREDSEYHQHVALKIVPGGSLDPRLAARFREERQLLARLEHPGIARLYDGGTSPDGRPYLVMEYVNGQPLDAYCDHHQLSLEERLALFARVCAAVQYLHRNLVVHRDLKPANILVTPEGQPKLLDFGIAKHLDGSAARASALTRAGWRLLTPRYASPEQVKGHTITTASDVYSLGVVLYELLAGHSPYAASLSDAGLEHAVCELEIERPSLAVARLPRGVSAPAAADSPRPLTIEGISHARGLRPGALTRRLRGDLDNIVGRALRKEPERRYESVGALVDDLERYARRLPVSARPDSVGYRLRRFVQRHRMGSAVAALALVATAAFVSSLVVQGRRLSRERDKARTALEFLVDTFRGADPYQAGGVNVSARDLLFRGERRVGSELGDQPEVQAALRDAIGDAYLGLGDAERAGPLLEQALAQRRSTLGDEHEATLQSLEHLAWQRFLRSDFAASEDLFRRAIAQRRRRGDSEPLAATLNRLGAVLREHYHGTDPERLRQIAALHQEALAIYARTQPEPSLGVAESLLFLATALKDGGDQPEAEKLHRQALDLQRRVRGPEHPELIANLRGLALTLFDGGRFAEAEALLREALAIADHQLDPKHAERISTLNDLALVRARLGDPHEAAALAREVLATWRAQFGEQHFRTVIAMDNLGNHLREDGRLHEALALHERAYELKLRLYGEQHVSVADNLVNRARVRHDLGDDAAALALARAALDMKTRLLGPDQPALAQAWRTLGQALLSLGRQGEAEQALHTSLALLQRKAGPSRFHVAMGQVLLGRCLRLEGRTLEAAALLRAGHASLRAQFGDADKRTAAARAELEALAPATHR